MRGEQKRAEDGAAPYMWSEYLDFVEQLRKTERGTALYAKRKKRIERVFRDVKENTPYVIHTT